MDVAPSRRIKQGTEIPTSVFCDMGTVESLESFSRAPPKWWLKRTTDLDVERGPEWLKTTICLHPVGL